MLDSAVLGVAGADVGQLAQGVELQFGVRGAHERPSWVGLMASQSTISAI